MLFYKNACSVYPSNYRNGFFAENKIKLATILPVF